MCEISANVHSRYCIDVQGDVQILPFCRLDLSIHQNGILSIRLKEKGSEHFFLNILITASLLIRYEVKATIPLTRRTLVQSRRGQFIHNYLYHAQSIHLATALVARVQL